MGAVAVLQVRQMLGGSKIWLLLAFLALPIPLAILIEQKGQFDSPEMREIVLGIILYFLYPQAICLLMSILYGTSLVSAELEGKTITYLFTRPMPKWKVLLSKYLAMSTCLAVPAAASLFLAWLILGSPGGTGILVGLALAVVLGAFAYTSIFTAIGVIFRGRPMVVGFIYGVIFEVVLSLFPAVINSITVSYYLRSVVARMSGIKVPEELEELALVVGNSSLWVSIAVPLGISAAMLALASFLVSSRESVVTEQV